MVAEKAAKRKAGKEDNGEKAKELEREFGEEFEGVKKEVEALVSFRE